MESTLPKAQRAPAQCGELADIAANGNQHVAKVGVEGSNPFARSSSVG